MAEQGDQALPAEEPKTVSKEDYDKLASDNAKLKADLEDLRTEVMSQDYLDFLAAKDGSTAAPATPPKQEDDQFKGMTSKQVYEKAVADATAAMKKEIESVKTSSENASKEAYRKEVAQFSRTHADFEQMRPIMYGLSLDPKYADSNLQELYDAAKAYVKSVHTEPSDVDKARSRRSSNEKPAGAPSSMKPKKEYSAESAAEEAWDEVMQGGELPPAL